MMENWLSKVSCTNSAIKRLLNKIPTWDHIQAIPGCEALTAVKLPSHTAHGAIPKLLPKSLSSFFSELRLGGSWGGLESPAST